MTSSWFLIPHSTTMHGQPHIKCRAGCAPSQYVPFADLLPAVTRFPQLNVLPHVGMTGCNLKCCTAPNSALTQFRVSPDPADGICAQNMPAPLSPLSCADSRGSRTWVHCWQRQCSRVCHRGELQQSAVICPVPLRPPQTAMDRWLPYS